MSFYSRFAEHYESVFPFRQATYEFLENHLAPPGDRVLDVGCGTGHYSGQFAARGYKALGLDLDRQMIKAATTRYPRAGFRCMDMTEIGRLPNKFHLAFCIGNVAAHLTREAFIGFLGVLCCRLVTGGHWIFQVVNWDFLLDKDNYRFPPRSLTDSGLTFLREYRELTTSGTRFQTSLAAGDKVLFQSEVMLYPMRSADYLTIHRRLGFELIGHYSDFGLTPFTADSNSGNIFVFRKKADRSGPTRE